MQPWWAVETFKHFILYKKKIGMNIAFDANMDIIVFFNMHVFFFFFF